MKKKNRRSIWLCCSVIQAKKKKNNNNNINTTFENNEETDKDTVSRIFGQNDNKPGRFKACICCFVVEELPPSNPRKTDSTFDMEVNNGPMTVVTGVPTGRTYG